MKITKAVITAAGYGTRMLPATKSMPKEMLPILDKPAIQYIVEECVNAGIRDILIILSRGKHVVEDHFDRSPDLERQLLNGGKNDLYNEMVRIGSGEHYLRPSGGAAWPGTRGSMCERLCGKRPYSGAVRR